MTSLLWILALAVLAGVLAYRRAGRLPWFAAIGALLLIATFSGGLGAVARTLLWTLFAAVAAVGLVPTLRRSLVSDPLFGWFRKVLPPVSTTEQEALDAGTVWWDGELFSGDPDWAGLLALPRPHLSDEEQAFLDGPVERLCAMVDEWQVSHELNDLPPHVWQFIRDNGFLGLIIPGRYGGKGFSALAHSEVVMKLSSRTPTACVSVMVPNSLGPAELLMHYGTEAQKDHYLPRLARGLEIPCFALTGPEAGSDAGSIPDFGIVCHGEHEGRRVLGMRVTWDKRYITLGPVATLLGLAFRVRDPDRLLAGAEDLGMTVALIPTSHPGVDIGRRHIPLNASFMNGPNWGRDVFIPMDWVVGGPARVGQGWRMLMECLAAGRSISLPASAAGGAKLAARTTGAYARIRTQFRTPIGQFEGVEEALARIGGNTYAIDAARVMTAGAIDAGERPSVISAIVKYHSTERARQVVNDAMDVHGGKGICLGPGNYLGAGYLQVPIGITVEGANILTRSMIIFGQGAIRCHPYVLREIAATRLADRAAGAAQFDRALCGHIAFLAGNAVRSLWLGLTGARLVAVPGPAALRPALRRLTRLAAGFALAADIAMLFLGGSLKRREKISARLGDVLSQLYIASCVVKRYVDEGARQTDLPIAQWALDDSIHRAQEAMFGVFGNFPVRWAGSLMRRMTFPFGRGYAPPSDGLGHRVARLMLEKSPARDRLAGGIYLDLQEADPVGRLELALDLVKEAEAVDAKVRAAMKAGAVRGHSPQERVAATHALGLIDAHEAAAWTRYDALRRACIMVDDFPHDVGRRTAVAAGLGARPGSGQACTQGSSLDEAGGQAAGAHTTIDLQQERA
ncbi:MAG: acyl-CoA dehydrogenase [Burkholderiales bacterium]|nr:acyl-CoA dehydrogenase [Burkholderiales bacterium]